MLRELTLFGTLAPSLLVYFLAAILLFGGVDWVVSSLGVYRLLWHPPLARFGFFLCIFSAPRVVHETLRWP
jgi:protein AaeX